MAKSVGVFIVFIAVAALLIALGVWWVGPPLVDLAVMDPQRNQSYTVANFAKGQPEDVYRARYQQPLVNLVASEGGEVAGFYRLAHLLEGEHVEEWTYMSQINIPRARDIVQIMTSSPYRLIHDSSSGLEATQLGSYATPEPNWRNTLVVWRIQNAADERTFAKDPLELVRAELGRGAGRIVWDGTTTLLSGDTSWHRILVVDFATSAKALDWLRHPEMQTARALANSQARNLALAIYTAGSE